MSLRDQLQAIYAATGGLSPAAVIQEATPLESPLHDHFEWDDAVAGPKFRLVQAAALIRSVKITYRHTDDGEPVQCRAFVSRYADNAYEPADVAFGDDVSAELVLREFRRQLQALQRNYGHLTEYRDVIRAELLGDTG